MAHPKPKKEMKKEEAKKEPMAHEKKKMSDHKKK
jgi:hypothetical protein